MSDGALVVGINNDPLYQGLNESKSKVEGWASSLKSSVGGHLVSLASSIKAGVVGAVVGVASTIFKAISEPFEKLDQIQGQLKKATALGIDPEQYQALSVSLKRAKIDGEGVAQMFGSIAKIGYESSIGNERAARSLAMIGLEANALEGLSPDRQFLKIADAIKELPGPAAQAGAAIKIFGNVEGMNLLPFLQKGSKGFEELMDKARATGQVLSTEQMKSAAEASKAWKEAKNTISATWDGLKTQATLVAAPIVKFLGEGITKAFELVKPVFQWLIKVIQQVADVVGPAMTEVGKFVSEAVEEVRGWGQEMFGMGVMTLTIKDVVVGVFRVIGTAASLVWDTLKSGAGVIAIAFGGLVVGLSLVVRAFEELIGLSKQLPDNVRPKWVDNMNSTITGFRTNLQNIGTDIAKWGTGAVTSWGTTAIQFNTWLDKIANKGKEKAKEQGEAMGQALAEGLQEGSKYVEIKGLVQGTKEAFGAEAKADWEAKTGLVALAKGQLKEQKEGNKKLDQIRDAIKKLGREKEEL